MTVKEYLILEHKINKGNTKVPQVKEKGVTVKKSTNKEINHIKSVCKEYGIEIWEEKLFSEIRRFRADMFLNEYNLMIEYNGTTSAKSRHLTITGYSRDNEKGNLATSKGYHVFNYTVLTYTQFETDLLRFFYHHGIVKGKDIKHDCPECGFELLEVGNILTSMPPQIRVICENCKYKGYKFI